MFDMCQKSLYGTHQVAIAKTSDKTHYSSTRRTLLGCFIPICHNHGQIRVRLPDASPQILPLKEKRCISFLLKVHRHYLDMRYQWSITEGLNSKFPGAAPCTPLRGLQRHTPTPQTPAANLTRYAASKYSASRNITTPMSPPFKFPKSAPVKYSFFQICLCHYF